MELIMNDITNNVNTTTELAKELSLEAVVPVQPVTPVVLAQPTSDHDSFMDLWLNANLRGERRTRVGTSHKLWANNAMAKQWIDSMAGTKKAMLESHEGVVFFNNVKDVEPGDNKPIIVLDPGMTFRNRDDEVVSFNEEQLAEAANKIAENISNFKESKGQSAAAIRREQARGSVIGYLNYFARLMLDDGTMILMAAPGTCELRDGVGREWRTWSFFKGLDDLQPGVGHDADLSVQWVVGSKNTHNAPKGKLKFVSKPK